ncbi:MAG: acetate--CoA ligase family protein [Desulfomonilaceae bacterium]|nr:acetate--CoA ligase family protein [Desulfomonilaceae bacterium]
MKDLFYPSSVVVIGVSTNHFNLGKEIARNLFEFQYTGEIRLVGRDGGTIFGRKIHLSLDEISDPIDLAVILTPARTVPSILEQCGRKGIRRVIIESGGFGEFDEGGRALGERLTQIAEQYEMRFIGPNCIGIINIVNGLAVPFPTLKNVFRRGGVGIIAQSGGVGLTYLNMFASEQIGFSKFAAIGNKINVDENDLLEYYVEDPDTSVVCLYLESIRDGRRLTDIARKSSKPIVVHKANVGDLSRVIAESHTEALANDDNVVDAALQQSGMIRFKDTQTYLDFLKILQLPQMKGRNLAIVSRSGGHAVIATDAAYMHGFKLPPFRQDFLTEIRKHLRADVIRLANPLDLGDLFDFNVYVRIIEHTLQEKSVDGIVFLHTYFAATEGEASRKLLRTTASMAEQYGKPCALCISTETYEISRLHKEFDFPIFMTPERAIAALDESIKYNQRRTFIARDNRLVAPQPPVDRESVRASIRQALADGRSPVLDEALAIIRSAGIDMPEHWVVRDPDEVDAAIGGLPGPFAVKVIAEHVSHKSDKGGVVLGLPDPGSVRTAVAAMIETFRSAPESGFRGVLVQEMVPRVPGAYELIIGGKRDPYFGPMVLLGHGGIFVEVFGKASLRMAPLSYAEIEEMIEELPGSEILDGVRGMPPVDKEALKDAVSRVAELMVNFPEINRIDVNPIVASSTATVALDARIFLES